MAEEKGFVVQIGLRDKAEMLYLTKPNWRQENHNRKSFKGDKDHEPKIYIPDEIADGIESWQYFGIDQSPASIELMIKKYKDRGTWICNNLKVSGDPKYSCIWDEFFYGHILGDPTTSNPHFLKSAPVEMSDVFRSVYLWRIDALIIDIDGVESSLFDRYDWSLTPKFIHIELHPFAPMELNPHNRIHTRKLLESKGYELAEEIRLDCHEQFRQPYWINEYVYHTSFIHRG